MDIDLDGKTAFVSGSTQGIGRAIAARLAECGALVYVNGRSPERVEAVVAELRAEQPDARFEGIAVDVVTDADALFEALPASTSSSTTSGSSGRRRCSRSTTRPGSATGTST